MRGVRHTIDVQTKLSVHRTKDVLKCVQSPPPSPLQNEGLLGNDTPGVGSTNSASFSISDHGYSRLQRNV